MKAGIPGLDFVLTFTNFLRLFLQQLEVQESPRKTSIVIFTILIPYIVIGNLKWNSAGGLITKLNSLLEVFAGILIPLFANFYRYGNLRFIDMVTSAIYIKGINLMRPTLASLK